MKTRVYISLPYRCIEYLFNRIHPLWGTFALTENCNAQCEYCQYWRKKHPELSTDSVLKIINKLKGLGVLSLVFSGGECLLRNDLVEIVSYSNRKGLMTSLVTNGIINDGNLFTNLMMAGLQTLVFSLDGSEANIHEKFRKGCKFNNTIEAIQNAVEIRNRNKFKTKIATNTVINKTNIPDLKNIYRLRSSLGADNNYFQPVWPLGGEKTCSERFGIDQLAMHQLKSITNELKQIPQGNLDHYYDLIPPLYKNYEEISKKLKCYAGRAFVHVDSNGILFPCSILNQEPMGSLLEDDIEKICSNRTLKKRIEEYKRFKCGGCSMACYLEKDILLSKLQNPIQLLRRIR